MKAADCILNRICSIPNHPISQLDDKYKTKYLKGLGACLCILSDNSPITKMFFEVWVSSILQHDTSLNPFWTSNTSDIKNAISIQRKGLKLFYMKECLFFDCLNILSDSHTNDKEGGVLNKAFNYLDKNICGFFSRKTLGVMHKSFISSDFSNLSIGKELLTYRQNNQTNLKSPQRVLVVANVSAGKSTLVNALVGYRVNRTKTTACTDKLVRLTNKLFSDGITTLNRNGFTYNADIEAHNSESFVSASFPFNSLLRTEKLEFIDTPGVNNVHDLNHRAITENAIVNEDYDLILYVSNCQYFGTNDEKEILSYIQKHCKKPTLFVLNQLDKFKQKEDSVQKMLKDYGNFLHLIGFKSPCVLPVSAKAGLLLKLPKERLDEEDLFECEMLSKKFSKDYFYLPRYVNPQFESASVLENTGILLLERTILKTIKSHSHEES